MSIIYIILLVIISYIIWSIPSAYLLVKTTTWKDVRKHWTWNIGTMNTHRTTWNKLITLLVLASDLIKWLSVYCLAYLLNNNIELPITFTILLSIAWLTVILWHNYSIFMKKFAGWKWLATWAGFFLLINPYLVIIRILVFFVVVWISKYMVLGQIIATILLPIWAYFVWINWYLPEFVFWSEVFLPTLAISLPIFIKHASRLKKIRNWEEPKLYYKIRDNL